MSAGSGGAVHTHKRSEPDSEEQAASGPRKRQRRRADNAMVGSGTPCGKLQGAPSGNLRTLWTCYEADAQMF
jgi:hypothetical protein